jgi:hypothetical protein
MDNDSTLIWEAYNQMPPTEGEATDTKASRFYDEFEQQYGQSSPTEYYKRFALMIHDNPSLSYDLGGILSNILHNDMVELEGESVEDTKRILDDIKENGKDSQYWNLDDYEDPRSEGSWNARDQEQINDPNPGY